MCEHVGNLDIGMTCLICLPKQASITWHYHEKKKHVSIKKMILTNRVTQRCSKVENMSWLKFCVEYDDEFVSHMEIMTKFLKRLKEV
jgi:hypothetical protein